MSLLHFVSRWLARYQKASLFFRAFIYSVIHFDFLFADVSVNIFFCFCLSLLLSLLTQLLFSSVHLFGRFTCMFICFIIIFSISFYFYFVFNFLLFYHSTVFGIMLYTLIYVLMCKEICISKVCLFCSFIAVECCLFHFFFCIFIFIFRLLSVQSAVVH